MEQIGKSCWQYFACMTPMKLFPRIKTLQRAEIYLFMQSIEYCCPVHFINKMNISTIHCCEN